MRCVLKLVAAITLLGAATAVRAQDDQPARERPRFHLGIAAGSSRIGADTAEAGLPEEGWGNSSVESEIGRKIVAGFRPVRAVGVEIQFIDFGEADGETYGERHGGGQLRFYDRIAIAASADARIVAALLFIPLASPSLDVYGKVGIADLDESFSVFAVDYECTPFCSSNSFSNTVDQSDSAPYVGFGARFKIARAAGVRVEYEAIDRDGGDPTTLISAGIAVEF